MKKKKIILHLLYQVFLTTCDLIQFKINSLCVCIIYVSLLTFKFRFVVKMNVFQGGEILPEGAKRGRKPKDIFDPRNVLFNFFLDD